MSSSITQPSPDAQTSQKTADTTQKPDTIQESNPEPEYLDGIKLYLLILALLLVVLIMTIDISIVSTATPRITDTFHTIADIGWYGAAFMLTNATLQPMSGKIYTFFPMKKAFISFLAIFQLGSLLCATSVSSAMFIVGRAVAGIGGSGLVNGSLTIIGTACAPEKKPMFMGIVMSIAGAGQLVGPLIGGVLTEKTTWRWCFYINLPCGALTILFLALISFPTSLPRRKPTSILKDFDLIGFTIFAPAIVTLMLALQWGGTTHPWSSPLIITLFVLSAILFTSLTIWERHASDHAMFPPHLLRLPIFRASCATGFFAGGTLLILMYYLPLYFQTVRLATPISSAISILPSFISTITFSILNGTFCPRVLPYFTPFALTGGLLGVLGTSLMTSFTLTTKPSLYITYQIIAGSSRGFIMQTPVQTVQQHIPKCDLPLGTAIVSFSTFLGGSVFLALGQTLFGNLLAQNLRASLPQLDVSTIMSAGATDILGGLPASQALAVRMAYNGAITRTMILGACASGVGVLTALGMGWKRVEAKNKGKDVGKGGEEKGAVKGGEEV